MADFNNLEELSSHLMAGASAQKWSRLKIKKRSGVLAPLFSVYSRHSVSIGDFSDLKLLIDWCKLTGNSILQLLPMNEMGAVNCPYDSVTSFGLESVYISLGRLLSSQDTAIKFKIDHLRQIYPAGRAHVNYGIKKEKLFLLWEIYTQRINNLPEGFYKFKEDNYYWLDDFALYKIIKGYQGYKPWYEWGEDFRYREPSCLKLF